MDDLLNFFDEVARLKTMPRTGWVWREVKNPETIAEHSFGTALMAWLLGSQTKLDTGRMMAMGLVHDICEVYAGDLTPYWGLVSDDPEERREAISRWIQLPQEEKKALNAKKEKVEREALQKLVAPIPGNLGRQIVGLWSEFEHLASREGSFVRQLDRMEALLQAVWYFGTSERDGTQMVGWWEGVEEVVEHPLLVDFLHAVHKHLYDGEETEFDEQIRFLRQAAQLKRRPRRTWLLRDVQNPDSVANHVFLASLMAWVLAKDGARDLEAEQLVKLSFASALWLAGAEERTPYDEELASGENREVLLSRRPRATILSKERFSESRARVQTEATQELLEGLPEAFSREVCSLLAEYQKNQTSEARFTNQVKIAESLTQALRYKKAGEAFAIDPWWEFAYESWDSPIFLEVLGSLKARS